MPALPLVRRVILALLALSAVTSCARYEYRNELDVPGLCPPPAPARSTQWPRASRAPSDTVGQGSLLSGIIETPSGSSDPQPVKGAEILLRSLTAQTTRVSWPDSLSARSDSSGRFALPARASTAGTFEVRVQGYSHQQRVDTVALPLVGDSLVRIAIALSVEDGPCSGLASVRVRKPWWKFW
jgi:hypothetical protein